MFSHLRLLVAAVTASLMLAVLPAEATAGPRYHPCHQVCKHRIWVRRITAEAEASPLILCIERRESGSTPTHLIADPPHNNSSRGMAQWATSTWLAQGGGRFASTPTGTDGIHQEAILVWAIAHGQAGQWTPYDGC